MSSASYISTTGHISTPRTDVPSKQEGHNAAIFTNVHAVVAVNVTYGKGINRSEPLARQLPILEVFVTSCGSLSKTTASAH